VSPEESFAAFGGCLTVAALGLGVPFLLYVAFGPWGLAGLGVVAWIALMAAGVASLIEGGK
jgi:hypothetical protein